MLVPVWTFARLITITVRCCPDWECPPCLVVFTAMFVLLSQQSREPSAPYCSFCILFLVRSRRHRTAVSKLDFRRWQRTALCSPSFFSSRWHRTALSHVILSSWATNPRTGGRPTQELAGDQPKNWRATDPRTGSRWHRTAGVTWHLKPEGSAFARLTRNWRCVVAFPATCFILHNSPMGTTDPSGGGLVIECNCWSLSPNGGRARFSCFERAKLSSLSWQELLAPTCLLRHVKERYVLTGGEC